MDNEYENSNHTDGFEDNQPIHWERAIDFRDRINSISHKFQAIAGIDPNLHFLISANFNDYNILDGLYDWNRLTDGEKSLKMADFSNTLSLHPILNTFETKDLIERYQYHYFRGGFIGFCDAIRQVQLETPYYDAVNNLLRVLSEYATYYDEIDIRLVSEASIDIVYQISYSSKQFLEPVKRLQKLRELKTASSMAMNYINQLLINHYSGIPFSVRTRTINPKDNKLEQLTSSPKPRELGLFDLIPARFRKDFVYELNKTIFIEFKNPHSLNS